MVPGADVKDRRAGSGGIGVGDWPRGRNCSRLSSPKRSPRGSIEDVDHLAGRVATPSNGNRLAIAEACVRGSTVARKWTAGRVRDGQGTRGAWDQAACTAEEG